MAERPGYMAERIRRPYPTGCSVLEGSTPVVSFGDVRTATVATLGLNPSDAEFLDKGQWLIGDRQRFETLQSLGLSRPEDADDDQVKAVLAASFDYFNRNPYWRWFSRLESVLNQALGVSYLDGSAVHLDLVQWATRPVWAKIPQVNARGELIEADREFLRQQLATENIDLVLMNGRTVMREVQRMGVILERHTSLGHGGRRDEMLIGTASKTVFVGWNKVFPAGGISTGQRAQIINELSLIRAEQQRGLNHDDPIDGGRIKQRNTIVIDLTKENPRGWWQDVTDIDEGDDE